MINIQKFWSALQAPGVSVEDIPLLLRDSIAYSFGDNIRLGDIRYAVEDQWVQGFTQPMYFASALQDEDHNVSYLITVYDGSTTKLGIVTRCSAAEFARYHAMLETEGVRAAIAATLGYTDAILISGWVGSVRVYVGDHYRTAQAIPTHSTLYTTDLDWRDVDAEHIPDITDVLGSEDPAAGLTERSAFLWNYVGSTDEVRVALPMEHYTTDAENVTTINTACDAILEARVGAIDGKIDTLTTACGSIASLVGSLSVFGNTVKDVTDRYNSVTQYIPRP